LIFCASNCQIASLRNTGKLFRQGEKCIWFEGGRGMKQRPRKNQKEEKKK
jgi:hypothetical protein